MSHNSHSGRKRKLLIMFAMTFTYMIAELLVGYYADCIALIADSFHMLSDVISLIVAFISILLSPKKWKKSTFGWARAEVLGALINSVFLMALCFSIIMESVQRFLDPKLITNAPWVLGVGTGGLVVNLIGLAIFHEGHGHSHHHQIQHQGRLTRLVVPDNHDGTDTDSGVATPSPSSTPPDSPRIEHEASAAVIGVGLEARSKTSKTTVPLIPGEQDVTSKKSHAHPVNTQQDVKIVVSEPVKEGHGKSKAKTKKGDRSQAHQLNMRGVFLHILADTLGSVVVIISAAIVWASGVSEADKDETKYKIIVYIDPMLSLIMVTLITCSAWPLLQETSMILLQTVPSYIDMEDLKRRLRESVPGIVGIHEFHVWQLAGDRVIASIHIVCKDVESYIRISRDAKEFFHINGIHSTTIQAEFFGQFDKDSEFNEKKCLLRCPDTGNPICIESACCVPESKTKINTA